MCSQTGANGVRGSNGTPCDGASMPSPHYVVLASHMGGETVILRPVGLRAGHKMCYFGLHSWLWGDECSLNVAVEQVACVQS